MSSCLDCALSAVSLTALQADESEDAAAEETTFLADTVQKLLSERQQLLEELHDIKREHSLLSKENVLLKNELLSHEAGLSPNQKGSPLKRRDNNTIEVTLFPRC